MAKITRRGFLGGVGVGAAALATAGSAAPAAAAPYVYSSADRARPGNGSRLTLGGPRVVHYEKLYRSGDSIQRALARGADLYPNERIIVSFPAGRFVIDDFNSGYFEGIRLGDAYNGGAANVVGIVGVGRNTLFTMKESARTQLSDSELSRIGTIQNTMIRANGTAASPLRQVYFGHFTLQGPRASAIRGYNGLSIHHATNPLAENIYFDHANKGWRNRPVGETMAFSTNRTTAPVLRNSEFNCWLGGERFSTSPIGFNRDTNVLVDNCDTYGARAGMPTFFEVNGLTIRDLASRDHGTGSGDFTGHGINMEQCSGTIRVERPVLQISYDRAEGKNRGHHMMIANVNQNVRSITVVDPVFTGSQYTENAFNVLMPRYYQFGGKTQKQVTAPSVLSRGRWMGVRYAADGTENVNPSTQFLAYT